MKLLVAGSPGFPAFAPKPSVGVRAASRDCYVGVRSACHGSGLPRCSTSARSKQRRSAMGCKQKFHVPEATHAPSGAQSKRETHP